MPKMHGCAATRQLTRFDAATPVVIVTDYDDQELHITAPEGGCLKIWPEADSDRMVVFVGLPGDRVSGGISAL